MIGSSRVTWMPIYIQPAQNGLPLLMSSWKYSVRRPATVKDLVSPLSTGFVLWQFDSYWISRQPENIMLFPAIKLAFLKQLKLKITGGTVVLAIDKV